LCIFRNDFAKSVLDCWVDLSDFTINVAIQACIQEMAYPPNEELNDDVLVKILVEYFKSFSLNNNILAPTSMRDLSVGTWYRDHQSSHAGKYKIPKNRKYYVFFSAHVKYLGA
jgi:hypothetical protein